MNDISFGKALEPLLAGNKTCTRRKWKKNHALKFINCYREGRRIEALDKDRRWGGKRVGWLQLVEEPYQQQLRDMPQSDLAAEGFPDYTKQNFIDQFFDGDADALVWVLRFAFEREAGNPEGQLSQVAVRIDELQSHSWFQPREGLDLQVVERYREMLVISEPPPILVWRGRAPGDEKEHLYLVHGGHRTAAQAQEGRESIPASFIQDLRTDTIYGVSV